MKISSFKRILSDELPSENKELADKIGYSINPFAEEITIALSKRLTVTDNFNQNYKELTFILSSGIPTLPIQFKSEISGRIKGMSVEFVENQDNLATYPTGAPFITFIENNSIVTIKNITGLQSGTKWKIRLLYKGD